MFEKEAEEYRTHFENELYLFDNTDIFPNDIEEAYQKGAEFGYNKANEWHYVKDGDLPVDTDEVLVCLISDEIVIDCFHSNTGWENHLNNQVCAWKEIVPPKGE